MKYVPLLSIAALLSLAACSDDHAMVANGYSRTAELSALDNQGKGNFAEPIEPKSCLMAFKDFPDLATMQIRIVIQNETDITYDSAALARAMGGDDPASGVFVVEPSGLKFEKNYRCDSEIR